MVTIDKSLPAQRLIFTLTESTTIESPFYLLALHSEYTNKTYRIQLPLNSSYFPSRYDEFILDTSIFNNVEAGIFIYKVYQSPIENTDEEIMGEPIEKGLARVIDAVANELISIEAEESDDDFIVYQP